MKTRARKDGGFTLLEAVAVLLLLSLAVAGVLPLLTTGEQTYDEARRRQELLRNARVALDRIVREVRAAQALREAASGVVRLDLAAEDGAQPAVEFVLDGASGDLQYRWGSDWDYRRRITVRAPAGVAVPAGYSVYVCFDHAALVSMGKSRPDGEDVRVRFWDGTRMVELDRFLDPTAAWNGTQNRSSCPAPSRARQVKVWFRLQAAVPAGGSDDRYFLYYGNLRARSAPSNPDHVFLDYEDGRGLEGWTRRDPRAGTYSATAADGIRFSASNQNGFRELSRPLAHGDVEVVWRFQSESGTRDGRQVGVGVRLSEEGAGYRLTPGDGNNSNRLRLRYWGGWAAGGGLFGPVGNEPIQEDVEYYARFAAVGNSLRVAVWRADGWDPGDAWDLSTSDSRRASGSHVSIVNGERQPMTHWHRFVWVRLRTDPEPTTELGPEQPGTRADPLATLAGPFRAVDVTCFDGAGATTDCADTRSVRQLEVRLVARDRDGVVPDVTVSARAVLRAP